MTVYLKWKGAKKELLLKIFLWSIFLRTIKNCKGRFTAFAVASHTLIISVLSNPSKFSFRKKKAYVDCNVVNVFFSKKNNGKNPSEISQRNEEIFLLRITNKIRYNMLTNYSKLESRELTGSSSLRYEKGLARNFSTALQ